MTMSSTLMTVLEGFDGMKRSDQANIERFSIALRRLYDVLVENGCDLDEVAAL